MKAPKKSPPQALPLSGVFRPRPHAPGFAIPVFSDGESSWVQEIRASMDDGQETVAGFIRCDVEPSHVLPVPQPTTQQVGASPIFAFRFPDGNISIGSRIVVQNAIRATLSELQNRPFVLWDCAEFLEDAELEAQARSLAGSVLSSIQTPNQPNDSSIEGENEVSPLWPDSTFDNPNEYTVSEAPLLQQLVAMGWEYVEGDLQYPAKTGRSSFSETILLERLKAAFRKVNLDEAGDEWLDNLTIERAIRELLKPEGNGLLEMNQHFMQRLVTGVRVTVAEGPCTGQDVTLHPIAWQPDRLQDNEFLAINQFQVLIKGTPYTKRPDVVLFVNGLPLVVIECKSPAISEPLQSALDDLLHYSGQKRRDAGEREGIPELFHFNALLIGTSFYQARAGTLGAS
ncbi:MAG TPA: type I restriction endonuclease, partial [Abditibacteriaceae bacterium]